MTVPNDRAPSHDERWGNHVPWSLRYSILSTKGDHRKFLTLLGDRLGHFFLFNDANIPNMGLFSARLASESLGRYQHTNEATLDRQIKHYLSLAIVNESATTLTNQDPECKTLGELQTRYNRYMLPGSGHNPHQAKVLAKEVQDAQLKETSTRPSRYAAHWHSIFQERMEVFQSLLFLLHQHRNFAALESLRRDTRRFAAECMLLLDIKDTPPTIVPLEEPLLQKEVLDKLLPRLEAKFPERARDLIEAYHGLLNGVDSNTVFGNAFKALEALARTLTGNSSLMLSDRAALDKHFPKLHGTIRDTILKLSGHRGDEGGHGRTGPDEWEIRYLLFSIANVALLFLDYSEHCG